MYPNYPYFAVAITRTCGSGGGSYIGKQLAKAFDIDLYDRKLLRLASEDSGINEELFARADENTRKTMLYRVSERVYDGSIIPPESGNFISDENLFNYQAKVLRELLNEESYICVGRAADFVLRDKPNVLTVYVDAPYDWRVEREMNQLQEIRELYQRHLPQTPSQLPLQCFRKCSSVLLLTTDQLYQPLG